jgi:hypothetical protein
VKNGKLQPGVFQDKKGDPPQHSEGGMSTDWEKYSTPQQTRERAKNPADNAVIGLPVGPVTKIPLEVKHTPDIERMNRAHTDIIGDKKRPPEVRVKLLALMSWKIRLEDPVEEQS